MRISVHALDLAAPRRWNNWSQEVGPVDILVNNAGDIPAGSLEVVDDAAWRKGFDLKVFGYITLFACLL